MSHAQNAGSVHLCMTNIILGKIAALPWILQSVSSFDMIWKKEWALGFHWPRSSAFIISPEQLKSRILFSRTLHTLTRFTKAYVHGLISLLGVKFDRVAGPYLWASFNAADHLIVFSTCEYVESLWYKHNDIVLETGITGIS